MTAGALVHQTKKHVKHDEHCISVARVGMQAQSSDMTTNMQRQFATAVGELEVMASRMASLEHQVPAPHVPPTSTRHAKQAAAIRGTCNLIEALRGTPWHVSCPAVYRGGSMAAY